MGYDKNYERYMLAFGVPSFVLSLILGASETLVIKSPTGTDDDYIFKTIMGNKYTVLQQLHVIGFEISYYIYIYVCVCVYIYISI